MPKPGIALQVATLLALALQDAAHPAGAQTAPAQAVPAPDVPAAQAAPAPSIVVTATRSERNAYDLPVSIDRIDSDVIQNGQMMNNLSETLVRVPGIVVLNRLNYAQDLQISSRGFGARAQFGVRGIRLYADGIPAASPDGQGQTSNFDLGSAERIEVMRGPFSSLYGNAAGGVIQVFTEKGPPEPTLTGTMSAGSYGTTRFGLKYGGQEGPLNYIGDVSRFDTDGYRQHSSAERDLGNAKLGYAYSDDTYVNFIANAVSQPALDPAGLTHAQVEQNRRQVDPSVLQFDTKKTVTQDQFGTTVEHRVSSSDSLRFAAYGGSRDVQQLLAVPLAAQNVATSSGGVVSLERGYYGVDARWTHSARLADGPIAVSVGTDYDNQAERRRGYINNNGAIGALKRDELDTVFSTGVYTQADWKFAPQWTLSAGLRYSRVAFDSRDYFIVPGNGDDSGDVSYSATTPTAGLVYALAPDLNLYANIGKGFETPSFAELAYRNSGGGLNFDLQPSTSIAKEVGVKAFLPGNQRLTFAVFDVETKNEIVIDTATGGRNTFKNAPQTKRQGAELSWSAKAGSALDLYSALTLVDARYESAFTSGSPAVTIPAGNYMPGVPRRTLFAAALWTPMGPGFTTSMEVRYSDRIYASDANTDWAQSYTIASWWMGFEQLKDRWKIDEFVRVDNLFNKSYIGSVIVGDTNGRFYEPSPGRTFMAGLSASLKF
jgi:iron complex outermembrane recepter protein